MRMLRFAVVGILISAAGSPKVTMAQWPSPYADAQAQATQAKQLRVQRQKQLMQDSDKLVKLSVEIRKQINDSAPGTLSADTFRKLAEIEKLAQSLRKQMKN